MPSCETCYHGGPLENICIAVILQSLLYNSYIIVVKVFGIHVSPLYVVIICVILCGGAIKCNNAW